MGLKTWRKKAWDNFHAGSKFALKHHKEIYHGTKALHSAAFGSNKHKALKHESMAGPLTTQNDATVIFKAKRRSRKRQTFKLKVQQALADTYTKKHLNIMRTWNTTTVAGQQQFNGISFYSYGQGDQDFRDIVIAMQATEDRNYSYLAESAHCDFLATNTTALGASNLILKVYKIRYKKDMLVDWGSNIGNFWINCYQEEFGLGVGSTNVGIDNIVAEAQGPSLSPIIPGQTPFDVPTFLRRVKILKVTEFNIGPGQTVSFNDNMMRTGMIHQDYFDQHLPGGPGGIANIRVWATPKWTTTLLFVYHGVPRLPAANTLAGFYPPASLCLVANKSYNFTKVETDNVVEGKGIRTII